MSKYKKIRLSRTATRDEHRLIMERRLGRRLGFNEVVHHKNHDATDNRPDNLEVLSRSAHSAMHITDETIRRVVAIGKKAEKPLIHGTSNAYFQKRCRCDLCKAVAREQKAAWRRRTSNLKQ